MKASGDSGPTSKVSSAFDADGKLASADIQRKLSTIAVELTRVAAEMAQDTHKGKNQTEFATGSLAVNLRQVIRDRRARDKFFGDQYFSEPAWDILLDLTIARFEDKQISVSSLCIAAAVPTTTALRWIKLLLNDGIITRLPDPRDARRSFVAISDTAYGSMISWAESICKND